MKPTVYTDAELISAALASGKVTILRPGRAAGLSRMDDEFGVYFAPQTMRQQIENQAVNDAAKRKRRVRA